MPRDPNWYTIRPMELGVSIYCMRDVVTLVPHIYKMQLADWTDENKIRLPAWLAFAVLNPGVLACISKAEPQQIEGDEK